MPRSILKHETLPHRTLTTTARTAQVTVPCKHKHEARAERVPHYACRDAISRTTSHGRYTNIQIERYQPKHGLLKQQVPENTTPGKRRRGVSMHSQAQNSPHDACPCPHFASAYKVQSQRKKQQNLQKNKYNVNVREGKIHKTF